MGKDHGNAVVEFDIDKNQLVIQQKNMKCFSSNKPDVKVRRTGWLAASGWKRTTVVTVGQVEHELLHRKYVPSMKASQL